MTSGWAPEETSPAQPGRVFPLRRMTLGEVLGGGLSMVRHAPRSVIGVPFAAGIVNFLMTLLMLLVFPSADILRMFADPFAFDDDELLVRLASDVGFILTLIIVTVAQSFILAVGFTLVALPTLRATFGFRTDFAQTLRLRSGRVGWLLLHIAVLSLLGLVVSLLVVVVSGVFVVATFFFGLILVLPGVLLLTAWLTAGFMYAPLVVVVEDHGPFSAIARSWRLNRGRWWINIGTVSLLYLMLMVMLTIASLPLGIATVIGSEMAPAAEEPGSESTMSMIIFAVGSLVDSLLTAIFIGLVGALVTVMYLNCRIHQESLDVTLLRAAEGTSDDGRIVPASVEHLGHPAAPSAAPPHAWGGHWPTPGPPSQPPPPPSGPTFGQPR